MTAGPRAATYASADASHTTVRLEGLCPVGSRNWPNHQTEGQELEGTRPEKEMGRRPQPARPLRLSGEVSEEGGHMTPTHYLHSSVACEQPQRPGQVPML